MPVRALIRLVAALVLALLLPARAHALWANGGNPVADSSRSELPNGVVTDETGGMIATFSFSSGDSLSIQRLNIDGAKLWGSQGVRVNPGGNAASFGIVRADSAGGAWVAWLDTRAASPGTGVYVQRFNAAGTPQFAAGGVRVFNRSVQGLGISTSATGKLLLAYLAPGSSGGDSLFAQRVSTTGTNDFAGDGVLLATDVSAFASGLDMHTVGEGCIVRYNRFFPVGGGANPFQQIWAQRLSANFVKQWGADGVSVYAVNGNNGVAPRSDWDGSFLYVAWEHAPSAYNFVETYPLRAQKVSLAGAVQWTANGVTVFTPNTAGTFFQHLPMNVDVVAVPATGEAIVGWMDGRNYNQPAPNTFLHGDDVYAQKLGAATGAAQWTANGAPVDTAAGGLDDLRMDTDGAGGALFAYTDFTFGDGDEDISVARVDGAGARLYKQFANTTAGTSRERNSVLAHDGQNGALVIWEDNRNAGADSDVWGTRRGPTGSLFNRTINVTQPNLADTYPLGAPLDVRWTTNFTGTVRILLRPNGSPPVDLTPAGTPNDAQQFVSLPTGTLPGQYKVIVEDFTTGVPRDSSNLFFTLCAPLALTDSTGTFDAPNDLRVADVNEDGRLDAVVAHGTGAAVLFGLAGGGFGAPQDLGLGTGGRDVAIEDFDSDGILDLAITTTNGVSILIGQGAGGVGNGTFGAPVNVPTQAGPRGIAAADFNEDGNMDLAVVNGVSNTISILLGGGVNGAGDGTFALNASYAVGTNPQKLAVGDFNEDGIWDLACTNNLSSGASLTTLFGQGSVGIGNGTFGLVTTVPTNANPIGIATGDFNDDGMTDLAVACASTAVGLTVHYGTGLLGTGNGGFSIPFAVPFAGLGRDVEVVDATGDGLPDLVVSDATHHTLQLLENTGGAPGELFTPTIAGYAGLFPLALALGDFDLDGDVDVLCANNTGDNVSVLRSGCVSTANAWIQVLASGTSVGVGASLAVSWGRSASVPFVDLEVSHDDGGTWETIARRVTEGSFAWTATAPVTSRGRIRITDGARGNVRDTTGLFRIGSGVLDAGDEGAPSVAAFSAPQPNPARGRVTFELALPRDEDVRVEAFDLLGRRVATLAEGRRAAGRHVLRWEGASLAGRAGVFLVRARAGSFWRTQRVVLVP